MMYVGIERYSVEWCKVWSYEC